MFMNAVITFFLIGIFAMLFVTPAAFAKGVFLIEYDSLSSQDLITSKVPILNICKAENLYTGKISVVGISYIALACSIVLRLLIYNVARDNVVLSLLSILLVIAAILFSYFANVYVVFIVINDAKVKSVLSTLVYALVFPVGQYYIGNFLSATIKSVEREEATFK